MKKLIILFIAVCSTQIYAQQSAAIQWQTDYSKAQQLVNSQDKMMLLFFADKASQSGIDANFLNTQALQNLSSKYVFYKVDLNSSDATTKMYNQRLDIHYNKMKAYPSILVINNKGQKLGEQQADFSSEASKTYLNFLKSL